jgi:carbonic anhydrase
LSSPKPKKVTTCRSLNSGQAELVKVLRDGNARFLAGTTKLSPQSSLATLKELAAKGQKPKIIVLTCSDSRVPVEKIFDKDVGELFVVRVAGNIVAPSLVGSIEFSAATFGSSLIMVLGHTLCGAVAATIGQIKNADQMPSENIHDIVSRIKPNIYDTVSKVPDADAMGEAIKANVKAGMSELTLASKILDAKVKSGEIGIVGGVFDLNTGIVEFL